ncbi:MAG: nucleoside triphosphate pyrophosphohydrolase family protein [Candidatus Gracilibacteria bacterium]|jgi:predicted HAD superfamily Cof-like phosphohydrolase|nr:nucleoside triphosphate pyrophosphohydrolase family protein [Candidatus Gracilibacteria bacterium]
MKKQLNQVKDFHHKFGSPVLNSPSLIDLDRAAFRFKIMQEELNEYIKGVENGDLKNIAKELSDLLYTVFGTIHEHGLGEVIEEVFNRTHASNMSKDVPPSGTKGIKGKNYIEADLSDIFNKVNK